MNPFKLRVRLDKYEFEAEGSEDAVKSQFDLFLASLPSIKSEPAQGDDAGRQIKAIAKGGKWAEIHITDLEKIYERGPVRSVKLKRLPRTDNQDFDTLVLLIYGIQAFTNILYEPAAPDPDDLIALEDEPATASQLIRSARKSGLDVSRIDRLVFANRNGGNFIFRGGAKKGSVYFLTEPGREHAVKLLKEMLDESEKEASRQSGPNHGW